MQHVRVTISPRKGLIKKIHVLPAELAPLRFAPFVLQAEKVGTFLVNLETDDTLLISAEEAELLHKWKRHSPDQYQIESNVEFIQILFDNNFIRSYAGNPTYYLGDKPKPLLPGKFLVWAKPFVWPLVILQICLILTALLLFPLTRFQYIPSFGDLFWTSDVLILFVCSFITSYVLLVVHELGHFITAKAFGVESRINLFSFRITQVVAETEHYFIYSLPKKERMLVYLSGILVDSTIFAILVVLVFAQLVPSDFVPYVKYVIFAQLIGVLWQMSVYYKTDIYNALSDGLDQENLYEDSLRSIDVWLTRIPSLRTLYILLRSLFPKGASYSRLTELSTIERRRARWFAWLFLIGVIQSIVLLVNVSIPRDIEFLQRTIVHIFSSGSLLDIFKGLLIIIVILWNYVILLTNYLLLMIKKSYN